MHYIISSVIFIIIKIGFSHIYYHKNWLKLILQSSAVDISPAVGKSFSSIIKALSEDVTPVCLFVSLYSVETNHRGISSIW